MNGRPYFIVVTRDTALSGASVQIPASLWHKQGRLNSDPSSPRRQGRKPRPPLDAAALDRLALHYLGRYATTRAKLAAYLHRKLVERGWNGERPPEVAALVERMAALGYVNDRAFAEARGAALGRRGLGICRVAEALRHAGVSEEEAAPARETAETEAWERALAFARRRRIGPFAREAGDDPDVRRKALAAMLRAGHPMDLAMRIVRTSAGEEATPP